MILNEVLIQEEVVKYSKNLVSNNEELNTKILEILKYEEKLNLKIVIKNLKTIKK